jgi:HPt (histidine-containing phosphotransfer) domain-containing protein
VSAIDPEIASQLAADLPRDVFVNVVRTFEADLARLVRQMAEAASSGDQEEFRRGAHGLAGAAGAIGALKLEALARQAMNPRSTTEPEQAILGLSAAAEAALAELMRLTAA